MKIVLKKYGSNTKSKFLKDVVFKKHTIAFVERHTRSQRKSKLWWEVRQGRFTASRFGQILKTRRTTGYSSYLTNRTFSNKAVEYGVDNESKAIELYQIVTGNHVSQSGSILHNSGALLASPDGFVHGEGTVKLLEVKCPFSKRFCKNLKQVVQSGAFYVKSKANGSMYLDVNTQQGFDYHHQVQGCLYMANVNSCDFVVYCPADILIFNITKDESWEKTWLQRLLKLWRYKAVPHILSAGIEMVR